MKQFFTNLAANLATVALLVVVVILLGIGIAAAAGRGDDARVPDHALLVVDLDQPLADRAAERSPSTTFEDAFSGGELDRLSLRAATVALRHAATDERIAGVLLRGAVAADGVSSGYGALAEFRSAIDSVRRAGKRVHAYTINPSVRDYYVVSAADVITMDPFGELIFGGMSATQVHLKGFLEKYGIGVQVSRVGKFKAAVEPFTRTDMSPENREQTRRYLSAMWDGVVDAVAASRNLTPERVRSLADSVALFLPAEARDAQLVDRVAHFDVVLRDVRALTAGDNGDGGDSGADSATVDGDGDAAAAPDANESAGATTLEEDDSIPQITLREYARIVTRDTDGLSRRRKVAIVYAQGDIVTGDGGMDQVGGDAVARTLRDLRHEEDVRAVVLRVNSPGGSVVASETIQRELALLNAEKPVVVSMGSLAASGGYWISTAARRVYAQPTTLTGSIGVFALFPNLQAIGKRNGITSDTVNIGRYADLFTIARPRTDAELALVQRSVDAVYDAFLARVAAARNLPMDSVKAIAEGRVWSGRDALTLGLVDELGGLDEALRHAASLANLDEGDYGIVERPRIKSASERLQELIKNEPEPVAARVAEAVRSGPASAARAAGAPVAMSRTSAASLTAGLLRDVSAVLQLTDPRGLYARLPFALQLP